MAIDVYSMDYDGCLARRKLNEGESEETYVIAENRSFLALIAEKIKKQPNCVLFSGTNRQSATSNLGNATRNNNGSAFVAMDALAKHLKIRLDKLLMADIQGQLTSGQAFDNANNERRDVFFRNQTAHPPWPFDESKASILYAQMHKVAKENPGEKIEFNFYDDKDEEILRPLHEFYTKYPELIPHNVRLNLHKYAGENVVSLTPINGTGMIDTNYAESTRDMWAADSVHDGIREKKYTNQYVTPSILIHRRAHVESAQRSNITAAPASHVAEMLGVMKGFRVQRSPNPTAESSAAPASHVAERLEVMKGFRVQRSPNPTAESTTYKNELNSMKKQNETNESKEMTQENKKNPS